MNGTLEQIEWYLKQLSREEKVTWGTAILWKNITCPFRGGPAEAGHCDTSAYFIARQFNGVKAGYDLKDNPKALLGRTCLVIKGHAFAIVGDFLVDWWAVEIAKQSDRMILHLTRDAKKINKLYGDRKTWVALKVK